MAYLRMNGIDTSIELNERCLHQFITCITPVLHQFSRHNLLCNQLYFVNTMTILMLLLTYQAYWRICSRQCLRRNQCSNLLMTERQFEDRKIRQQQARVWMNTTVGDLQDGQNTSQGSTAQFVADLFERTCRRLRSIDLAANQMRCSKNQFGPERIAIQECTDLAQNGLLLFIVKMNTLIQAAACSQFSKEREQVSIHHLPHAIFIPAAMHIPGDHQRLRL